MAKKGRPKKSLYEKYVTAFNRAKSTYKSNWYMDEKLDKSTFDNVVNTNNSDKQAIKDIIDKQKYGRLSKELKGRRDFYETELKKNYPDLKWSKVKNMSHEEFVDTYGDVISETYNSFINSGWSVSDTKQLISQYIFGSE